MSCDLCKENTRRTLRAGSWRVCQPCVRGGVLARAIEVEFDIAKLQKAVAKVTPAGLPPRREKLAVKKLLETAYDAYGALTTAMNDLATCTADSKALRLSD